MKISSMKLKNFRGYKNQIEIDFDNLTVFVGRNDIGKSTILEALDIFFNDLNAVNKIEKADVNVDERKNNNLETIISVCFKDFPNEIIIDSTSKTTLENEFLLNKDRELEIIKKYKDGGKPKIYIKAFHPTNENCADLLLKKNTSLKKIIDTHNIECNNLTSNSDLRSSIWDYFSDNLQLKEVEIDITKEDAKNIWTKLSTYLPIYSLFQSDRKNSDSDSEIQDPLKSAVKEILKDQRLQKKLEEVAEEVSKKLKDVSVRTLDKLKEMDENIASSLNPKIPQVAELKWNDVFKNVSITGDEGIPINKRGSGVKRLVLLNFFRAEAERKYTDNESEGIIYAIEEPETSQHTANQKLLIDSFKSLSQNSNTQILLTTHSPNIVKRLNFKSLRLVMSDIQSTQKIIKKVEKGQLKYPSLNEVNYLAFGEISEEYHNELYSFIEYSKLLSEYKKTKPTMKYIYENRNGKLVEDQKVLSEYIRHQIHHPENKHNTHYTEVQLKQSITEMRSFISEKIL
ncbi:MAG: ATP-binding protein [Sphaerochaetaceae bacterium]|nr:ATP-binding protein [Sphaerochaetaceae bacterium]